MKSRTMVLGMALSLAVSVTSAHATTIAYDGFDYGATEAQLDGASFNGGTGWGGNWVGRGGAAWGGTYSPTSNISVPGAPSVGGGIIRTGETAASTRSLSAALNSGTYYISMNLQVDAWGWDPKFVGARFIPQGVYDSEFGQFGLKGVTGGASLSFGSSTGTTVYPLGAGSLQTVVLKMDLDTNTGTLFSVTDATSFTGNENDYATGVTSTFNRFNYYNPADTTQYPWIACEVDVWSGANGKLDEFRIATTFSEAVGIAVPEPASLSLLGAGAIMMLGRRRKL